MVGCLSQRQAGIEVGSVVSPISWTNPALLDIRPHPLVLWLGKMQLWVSVQSLCEIPPAFNLSHLRHVFILRPGYFCGLKDARF